MSDELSSRLPLLITSLVALSLGLWYYLLVIKPPRDGRGFINRIAFIEKQTVLNETSEGRARARTQLIEIAREAFNTRNPWIKNRLIGEAILEHLEHLTYSAVELRDLDENAASVWQEQIRLLIQPILYFPHPSQKLARQG